MGYQGTSLGFETIRSLDGASISGSYTAVGSSLLYPARIVKISNDTGVSLLISIDGSTDMDWIPTGGFSLYDAGTNRGNPSPALAFAKGTRFYVKGSSTSGSVYITCLYAKEISQTPPL